MKKEQKIEEAAATTKCSKFLLKIKPTLLFFKATTLFPITNVHRWEMGGGICFNKIWVAGSMSKEGTYLRAFY
jgi:hypothetical protein